MRHLTDVAREGCVIAWADVALESGRLGEAASGGKEKKRNTNKAGGLDSANCDNRRESSHSLSELNQSMRLSPVPSVRSVLLVSHLMLCVMKLVLGLCRASLLDPSVFAAPKLNRGEFGTVASMLGAYMVAP